MKQKINLRLALVSLIAIVMTVIGITLVYYSLFQQQVREDLKGSAGLLAQTGIFQNQFGDMSGREHLDEEEKIWLSERFRPANLRITWVGRDGRVFFDNDADAVELPNHLDRPEIQRAIESGEGESTRHSDTMNMDTFYYALLLENSTVLRVSVRARTITNILITAMPVIAVIAVFILLGCVLIGHLLTRWLMKPLEEMAENLDDSGAVLVYKELEPFIFKIRSQHENILAAAKSRQDFTANISHELKTPITAISGYAELIENHLIDEESESYIACQIRHNAERLLSLITDIIRLSELDHKELPREFKHFDLLASAQECVGEYMPMSAQKNVKLSCRGTSVMINADYSLIREMIDNLIQNAIRYNKENGAVCVTVGAEEGHPVLSVRDTGIGISAEHQKRVFERFYRVDKSRSRETGGTGLGLAIVKHIAEIHSAEIFLESEIGRGTDITVKF